VTTPAKATSATGRVHLDPKTLLIDVNIRKDARLDKDFVASIKELGVLVPLVAVRTTAGEVRVRFGHRRTLAAIEAGLSTVPVDVVGDEATDDAGQIDRILTQHAENAHRAGLTEAEHLGVVQQLQAFGLSAAQIAKRARIKRATVDNAIVVAHSSVATSVTERYDFLSLEQSAAVAEFEDDKEAVKALVAAAAGKWPDQDDNERPYARRAPARFDHVLQRLRDDRKEREAKRIITEPLEAKGVTVVDPPRWSDPTKELEDLGIAVEDHTSCSGHVAWVDERWLDEDEPEDDDEEYQEPERVYVAVFGCSDPEGNGHIRKRRGESAKKRAEREAAEKEEKRRVLANNKAWRSAEVVRREWLKTFLAGKKPPAGALRFLLSAVVDAYSATRMAAERFETARDLLGIEVTDTGWGAERRSIGKAIADASDDRAQVIALGIVLGAVEETIDVRTWRRPSPEAARHLSQLQTWGYGPSEIEQTVIAANAHPYGEELDGLEVRSCGVCGCTDEDACDDGCTWVELDLCSACGDEDNEPAGDVSSPDTPTQEQQVSPPTEEPEQ
jgi:ParB family chromosome partitioning protein